MPTASDRSSLRNALFSKRYPGLNMKEMTALQKQNVSFALSTNARGLVAIKKMESIGMVLKDANVLDVGCAYGGFSIETRRRGAANVYGIDVNDELICFARANLSDETEEFKKGCCFVLCDMTSEKALELPNKFFDIIIVNDVFEHIYDTTRLMSILRILADTKCVLYFMIPNGLHYLDWVEKEPHYHQYGLSILEPDLWHKKAHRVYYRRWEYYAALFKQYGFERIQFLKTPTSASKASICEDILAKYTNVAASLKERFNDKTDTQTQEVLTALEKYDAELQRDIIKMNEDDLHFKYLTDFWEGVAYVTSSCNDHQTTNTKMHLLKKQYDDLANSKLGRIQIAVWKYRAKRQLKG